MLWKHKNHDQRSLQMRHENSVSIQFTPWLNIFLTKFKTTWSFHVDACLIGEISSWSMLFSLSHPSFLNWKNSAILNPVYSTILFPKAILAYLKVGGLILAPAPTMTYYLGLLTMSHLFWTKGHQFSRGVVIIFWCPNTSFWKSCVPLDA